jgi:hypothetical protein
MTEESELSYYGRREAEERTACERAVHPTVVNAHIVMAERYAGRVLSLEEGQAVDEGLCVTSSDSVSSTKDVDPIPAIIAIVRPN